MDGDDEQRAGCVTTEDDRPERDDVAARRSAEVQHGDPGNRSAGLHGEGEEHGERWLVGERAVDEEPGGSVGRRRDGHYLRRGAVAAVLVLGVALAVSAFARVGPSTDVDQTFVTAAQERGHVVAPGEQRTLLVSAARKICDRRENHATVAERRATALSIAEITAVEQVFVDDTSGFTSLALQTYCPN